MSIALINQYYQNLDRTLQYGKSSNEQSIRNHFWFLLNQYAHKFNYEVVPEVSVMGTKGKKVNPDGTVKNLWGLDIGYWESKDEKDDINAEIDAKIKKGYPLTNILFEDSNVAYLYQRGTEVAHVKVREPEKLNEIITDFLSFKSETVYKFEEAIEKYNEWGERDDLPGRSMENPIIFEADNTNQTWLTNMESWFNESDPAPKDLAVIIPDVGGVESIRWNCTSFIPDGYEPGVDNRTRFTLINSQLPDIILEINLQEPDPFGSECSMNLENDPDYIYFDGQKFGCPSLEVDTAGQVMTLTWDFEEASGIWTYFNQYFQGYDTKFQVIASWLIDHSLKQSTFDGCFPLHFQHLTGFGLDKKAILQVKIWYVRMREA